MFTLVAHADSLDNLLMKLSDKIINPLIELSFVIALVLFLWGVMQYIQGAGEQEKRKKGQQHMIWGIVGFLIMFCVFGIITLLTNTLGISGVSINGKEQKFTPPPIQDLKTK